jgi:hypothetical protein
MPANINHITHVLKNTPHGHIVQMALPLQYSSIPYTMCAISLVPRCTPSKLNIGSPSRSLARQIYAAIILIQQNGLGLVDGLVATARGPAESVVFLRTSNTDVMCDGTLHGQVAAANEVVQCGLH